MRAESITLSCHSYTLHLGIQTDHCHCCKGQTLTGDRRMVTHCIIRSSGHRAFEIHSSRVNLWDLLGRRMERRFSQTAPLQLNPRGPTLLKSRTHCPEINWNHCCWFQKSPFHRNQTNHFRNHEITTEIMKSLQKSWNHKSTTEIIEKSCNRT